MKRWLFYFFGILLYFSSKISASLQPVCCSSGLPVAGDYIIRMPGSSQSVDLRENWSYSSSFCPNANPLDPGFNQYNPPAYISAAATLNYPSFCIEALFMYSPQCYGIGFNDEFESNYTQIPFFYYGEPSGQYVQIDFASSAGTYTEATSNTPRIFTGKPTVTFKTTSTQSENFNGWTMNVNTGGGQYQDVTDLLRPTIPVYTTNGPRQAHFAFCSSNTQSYVVHTIVDFNNALTDTMITLSTAMGGLSSISTSQSNQIYLGYDPVTKNSFLGLIDELRIWNTTIPVSQIRQYRYATFDPSNLPPNLVHYWNFNGNLNDVVGNINFTPTNQGSSTIEFWDWTNPTSSASPIATAIGADSTIGSGAAFFPWESPIRDLYISAPFGTNVTVSLLTSDSTAVVSTSGSYLGEVAVGKLSTASGNQWNVYYTALTRALCVNSTEIVSLTGTSSTYTGTSYRYVFFTASGFGPSITSISYPNGQSGFPTTGGTLTLSGTGLGPSGSLVAGESATVSFGYLGTNNPCSNPTVSGNSFTCTVPSGVGGNNTFTVVLCGTTYMANFTFLPPSISSIYIDTSTTPGNLVVSGSNFGDVVSAITAQIGTTQVGFTSATVVSANHTTVVVAIPVDQTPVSIKQFNLVLTVAGQTLNPYPISPGNTIVIPSPVKTNNTTQIIIGAVVGGVMLIVIIVLFILVIIYRRRKAANTAPFTPVNKKDFTPIIFGAAANLSPEDKKKAGNIKELEELLVQDDLKLAFAISDITQITEADTIAKALVIVFEAHDKTLHLLKRSIHVEVETTESAGTLFRSNSMVSKMFKFYSRLIGLPYLYTTIGQELNQLIWEKKGLEVDPERMEEGADLDEMRWMLMVVSQKILKSILASVDKCPPQFRVLCKELEVAVSKRFPPDTVNKTIGGFIFLRFFCPAVTSPESYGIVEEQPSFESRRLLILMTKVLQNLSNNVEFGSKELYMTKMNDFIQSNRDKLNNFFTKLINVPDSAENAPSAKLPKDVKEESLYIIGKHLQENLSKVTDPDLKKKLEGIVGEDQ